jgi:4-hydroxybutyrate CoA-transferase
LAPPDWASRYRRALTLGERWLDALRAGDRIFVGSAAGRPCELVSSLAAFVTHAAAVPPSLTAYHMLGNEDSGLLAAAGDHLRFVGLTFHPSMGAVEPAGAVTFLPLTIYQLANAIDEGRLRFEVALIQTSPPDADGRMSLGASVDFAGQAVRCARFVVAEVNDRSPRTLGDSFIHVSDVDAAVETSRDLAPADVPSPDPDSDRIADRVLDLIPDRATVEIGIGSVMTAVLLRLSARRELGLHTGLLTDPMVDLIASGVVTNRWKGIDDGVTVANQCRGTSRLYGFLHNNPSVSLRPARYTHDPGTLASLRCFRAINSAIEVDLLGRVNAEFVGARRVSSVGGLADFVAAASVRDSARSVIALRSTTRDRQHTRIVPTLASSGVTLPAHLADLVVTEHGIADLRGADAAARAKAMITIAHPAFRSELETARRELTKL